MKIIDERLYTLARVTELFDNHFRQKLNNFQCKIKFNSTLGWLKQSIKYLFAGKSLTYAKNRNGFEMFFVRKFFHKHFQAHFESRLAFMNTGKILITIK